MNFDLDLLFSNPLYIAQKLVRDNVRKYGKELKGKLLDIGCGRKPYKKFLSYNEYIGLDNNSELNPDVVGSIYNLPFSDNSFDSILCTAVLEHIPEPENGIKEIYRVLKSNGVAYISVPMTWYLHYEPNDYFRFTKYGLIYLLKKNGFLILEIDKIGGLFSYLGVRFSEIIFNVFSRLLLPLPIEIRNLLGIILTIPISLFFYLMSLYFDKYNKKNVFAWGCLVKKQ